MKSRPLISFDWALKKLLRNNRNADRTNFIILEGFLSVLHKKDITVIQILESESNPDNAHQKGNRVDLLVENEQKERIIIELQYNDEYDYFQRMVFATSKHLIENFEKGEPYANIKKIYAINLVYFELGQGKDYVYYGKTEFRGIHEDDVLGLSENQKKMFSKQKIAEIYPEYYVIKINNFDDIAQDSLDEWIYYFKHDEVKDEFKAKGLEEVRAYLKFEKLSINEQKAYDRYLDDVSSAKSMIFTAKFDGIAEGRAEGVMEGLLTTALKMKADGLSADLIFKYTGLLIQDMEHDTP